MIKSLTKFRTSKLFTCSFALLLGAAVPTLAQTGPGGVGNPTGAGGQPRVALWLRSDLGVTPGTNAVGVSAWADQSGNGNNFAQAAAGNQPVYNTNIINGRPILRFDGIDDFIRASGAGLHSANALPISFFAVTNSNASQTNPKGLFDSAPGNTNVFRFFNDGGGAGNVPPAGADNTVEFWANNPALGGYTLNASAPSVLSVIGDLNAGNRRLTAFRDAVQIRTATGNNTAVVFANNPQFGRINAADGFFNGDIGDAIIFNTVALNAAQRLVVENHLGAKFGRNLGANDYYEHPNTSGATGFNYDVIGIMGLNTGEKQSNSSTPNGAVNLTEQTGTLTTAGTPKCTFIGHNNTGIAATTNFMTGLSPTYTHNLSRDYWIQSTGTHSYAITFDFAAAGFTCLPSTNPNDYMFIARSDQVSNYGPVPIVGTPVLSGTKVTFIHSTTGGSAFINVGYKNSSVVTPTIYSFNTNCSGGCDWSNNANWTADPTGLTYVAPLFCSVTSRVILNGHTVNILTNGATSPSVTINAGGRLNLGTTTGHTFTTLAGGGTLGLASATFPTVTTNTHITTAGSTVEFNGTNNYNVPAPPNLATTYRNLTITGGGSSIKTLVANCNVAENLVIANLTSFQVAANNLTVLGSTNIDGNFLDGNAVGTTSLQNVALNAGSIDGGAVGIVNIAGTLALSVGSSTIGQTTLTVAGATTIPVGATVNFTNANGDKTFTGAITIDGNWTNSGNEEFFFGNNFTLNSTSSFVAGINCNYTFQGTGTIGGTMTTYTLPIMRVRGAYTNNVQQLFVTGDIRIEQAGKLVNATGIVPPYFMGFNTTRLPCWRMNATSVSNDVGNSAVNNTTNTITFTRAAGALYTVRHTDIQTNTPPVTAQAIMVQFTLGTNANAAATGIATISVGNGGDFADNANVPTAANTTAALTVNFETGNSMSLTAGATNVGVVANSGYTWFINPTGATITYKTPFTNGTSTVGAGTMDVWRGNALGADEIPITNTGVTPTDFKFVFNSGVGNVVMSNLLINPITTPIIGTVATGYCTSLTAPSAPFNVPFSLPPSDGVDTHFNPNNTIQVQLSNATGSFATPTIIGTLTTTAISGTVTCAIPANTQGAAFRMRVVTRESGGQGGFVSADNGADIAINGYRTSPTLPQVVNIAGTGATLSITNFAGGAPSPTPTSYQWAYRILGSPTVYNIAGATTSTYAPAPPMTNTTNTYYVFCILTSSCGSSFSDAVAVLVNCAVTTDLLTNGNFSATSGTYAGTLPVTAPRPHVDTGLSFATQYGQPAAGTQALSVINCSSGGRETCSMFPETTYAVSFNPRNHHTNFCDLRTDRGLNVVTTRTGDINAVTNGSTAVTGTGTNFTSMGGLVGSVLTNEYTIQRDYGTLTINANFFTITRAGGTFAFDAGLVGSYLTITVAGTTQTRRVTGFTDASTISTDPTNLFTMTGASASGSYNFAYSNERVIASVTSATAMTVTPAWNVTDAYFSTNQTARSYRYIHGSRVVGGSGGYMLTANGAVGSSINLWQQNVTVTPGKDYILSFNAINLNSASPLQFATIFNCVQVGTAIDNPAPELCSWARYSVQWNSGSKNSVSIAIRNIGAFASGNDMTIDDIVFYECATPVGYPTGESFVWRGITNDWFNGDNWGTCNAPLCGDDVLIPVVPFGRFYPVINNTGATARNIQLDAGASLTMFPNRNLDVCGNFNNDGTTIFDPSSSVSFVTDTRNPQLVTGNWTGANRFANVIVNKATNGTVLRFDTDIDILRNFTITRGTVDGNSKQITVGANFTNDVNGTFTANNSTVTFNGGNLTNNGAVNQVFTNNAAATACQFYNATLNQSATNFILLNHDFTVINVLTLTRGKFQRNGASGFRYVNVTNNAAASIVAYNTNSYIATIPFNNDRLILRRAIANTSRVYDYPVGDITNYELARLEITAGLGAAVTQIDGFFTTLDAGGTLSNGNCNYQPCSGGYWTLNPNAALGGTALYNMELFPIGFTCATVCTVQPITIAKGTYPNTWNFGGSSFTSAYKRSGFTSFTDFVPMGGFVILPVTLVSFEAVAKGDVAELTWITSSERDNKQFIIQRSANGIDFQDIGIKQGAGNSNRLVNYQFIDTKPQAGTNYYRLLQEDLDGKKFYSKIEAVNFSNAIGGIAVYPNPVQGNSLTVKVPVELGEEVLFTLTDMLGKIIYQDKQTYKGQYNLEGNYPTGVYILTVITPYKIYQEKVKYLQK